MRSAALGKRAQTATHWEDLRERVGDELRDAVLPHSDAHKEANEIDDIWEHSAVARERTISLQVNHGRSSRRIVAYIAPPPTMPSAM